MGYKKQDAKTQKRPRGRPSKYTPEIVDRILFYVSEGNWRTTAAAIVGISRETLWEWEQRHPEFADALKQAEANGEHEAVQNLKRESQGWQRFAWYLERRHGKRWHDGAPEPDGPGTGVNRALCEIRLPDGACLIVPAGTDPIAAYKQQCKAKDDDE